MDESTTNAVRMARLRESTWTQPFVFPVGKTQIDLSAVGTKAITPTLATNQPKMFPSNSRYLFDPLIYTYRDLRRSEERRGSRYMSIP